MTLGPDERALVLHERQIQRAGLRAAATADQIGLHFLRHLVVVVQRRSIPVHHHAVEAAPPHVIELPVYRVAVIGVVAYLQVPATGGTHARAGGAGIHAKPGLEMRQYLGRAPPGNQAVNVHRADPARRRVICAAG